MREIKYRFYDKRVKKMYYPNPQQLPFFINACMQDRFKNVIIPMQATGIFDSTKFKDLSEKEQKKFLLTKDKDSWRGYEIYEGDITAIRYDKERTEYDVVSYYKGGFSKGCTALSSYQKFTKIVGNLFEGYPEEANYSVNFYKENYEEAL